MIVLYLLVSVGCCTIRASIINPELTAALNWWDARSLCKTKFRSDLLKPDTKLNISNLVEGERYWVAALETYRWRWQGGSYLNRYRGYADLSIQESDPTHLSNNSVNACFNICKRVRLIGLSGEKCYCFEKDSIRTSGEDADPCPGSTDPNDKCGNMTGMSVYKTDKRFSEKHNGKCAVVISKKITGEVRIRSSSCTRNLYSLCKSENKDICSSEMCVSPHKSNWQSANQACQLITITNRNIEKLKIFLKEIRKRTCWIRLQKIITRRWVDGTRVVGVSSYEADNQLCLATFKFNMTFVYEWLPCEEQHSALCAAAVVPTTTVVTPGVRSRNAASATKATAGNTMAPRKAPQDEETTSTYSPEGTTEGSETAIGDEMKNRTIIVYICIGVGVGLFILLAVALSGAFFLKRTYLENVSVAAVVTHHRSLHSLPPITHIEIGNRMFRAVK